MKLQHLSIRRFRGINELDWAVAGDVSCFVGPSDATKTTVLDAIELVLGSRWSLTLDDGDFYDADHTTGSIEITATVTDVPAELIDERKYGRHVRGWTNTNQLRDEPQDDDAHALTIRLTIDDSLEPEWCVVTDRNDPAKISSRDRDRLRIGRAGAYVDRHLSWGRGSALSRMSGTIDAQNHFHSAARTLRSSIPAGALDPFRTSATAAATVASTHGVAPHHGYMPALDRTAINFADASVSLHDGNIPVRRAGLGTRRLVTVAMQVSAEPQASVVLIDEIEHGLEPHRLRTLLHKLTNGPDATRPQVFITTHSPVAIEELDAQHICVVRSSGGTTTITRASEELQPIIRRASHALVSRKIIVCEGRTEIGLVRALDRARARGGNLPMSYAGCCPTDGQGHSASTTALRLAELGYPTCLFVDADTPLKEPAAILAAAGVTVVRWQDGRATEDALINDLPWAKVLELTTQIAEVRGTESVVASVNARVGATKVTDDIGVWTDVPATRQAIAEAAKSQQWFKDIPGGERLGEVIAESLASIPQSDTATKLETLMGWVGDGA